MKTTRVTIVFTGRVGGALGVVCPYTDRRTLKLPNHPSTYEDIKELAREALYSAEGSTGSPAYDSVIVTQVMFN